MAPQFTGKVSFGDQRQAKLGTKGNPARVTVPTDERRDQIAAIAAEGGWECEVTVDAEKPEDISDLDLLRTPKAPVTVEQRVGRNDPCPCGSGKKYKRCCGA